MTKEEHIEALKEAKKWETEQITKMDNIKGKLMGYPVLTTFGTTLLFLATVGVKEELYTTILMFFNFIVFNGMAFHYQKKYIIEAKEFGVTKGTSSFGFIFELILGNILGFVLSGMIIVSNT